MTDLRLGGTQSMLLERVRRPGPFRHQVLVFALNTGVRGDASAPPPDLAAEFAAGGAPARSLDLKTPRSAFAAWLDRRLAARLREILDAEPPALVHSTLFHTHLLGEHLRRARGVPHVASKEGLDLWMRPWHRALESAALRRATRVVAVSSAVARGARALGVAEERLRTIPNGIDLERPGTWDLPPDDGAAPGQRLVAVGRCDPAKGWDDLLQAMPEVLRRRPRVRLDLLVSGTEADRARLFALARRLRVAESVRLPVRPAPPASSTGSPAAPALAPRGASARGPAMGRADSLAPPAILVVPSREEGFGLVLLEGMARGLPIVATDVGGIPEVARADREALLVPPRNPGALARGILRLLDDPGLAAALARAGPARARAFSLEEMARRYHDLYHEILDR